MPTLTTAPVIGWLVLAILAAIVEVLSPFFGFIFVTVAALVAGVLGALGLSVPGQLLVFGVSLFVCLALIRPRLIARIAPAVGVPSRTDRLLGARGRVVEPIDPIEGTGRVLVDGTDWAARSTLALPVGADIVVCGADGITLEVDRAS